MSVAAFPAAKGSYDFSDPLWFKIIWMKVDLLPELLRWGYHVIWSDLDVVNPSHHSRQHSSSRQPVRKTVRQAAAHPGAAGPEFSRFANVP